MTNLRNLITLPLLLTAVTLFAQTAGNQLLMKVNVPFAFTVDNQTLPAGRYDVKSVTPEHSIALISADGKHTFIVKDLPNYASSPSPDSRLVFHKYGNEYFLVQIWTAGDKVARNPFVSKRALELAQAGYRPEDQIIPAFAGR